MTRLWSRAGVNTHKLVCMCAQCGAMLSIERQAERCFRTPLGLSASTSTNAGHTQRCMLHASGMQSRAAAGARESGSCSFPQMSLNVWCSLHRVKCGESSFGAAFERGAMACNAAGIANMQNARLTHVADH